VVQFETPRQQPAEGEEEEGDRDPDDTVLLPTEEGLLALPEFADPALEDMVQTPRTRKRQDLMRCKLNDSNHQFEVWMRKHQKILKRKVRVWLFALWLCCPCLTVLAACLPARR
jgi:hypothetical protein